MRKFACLAIAALIIGWPRPCAAQYVQHDVFSFQAVDQDMWGGGGATSVGYEAFLGVQWDKSLSIGGILGSSNTVIIPGGCIWFFGTHCWDAVTADTRTGLQITAQTAGRIGINVGAAIGAGDVDVSMPGQATISTGSLTAPGVGSLVTLNTGFAVDPAATMHTAFPSVELWADFVFDVSANGTVNACLIFAGCTSTSGTLFDIDATLQLASFNRYASGKLKVLGIEVPLEGSIGPVDFTVSPPNLQTDASAASTDLSSSGDVNVLELGVDVPSLIASTVLPGSEYALSGDWGGFSYTVLSTSLGPRFGFGQEFTFTSTPMTTLTFSSPVKPVVSGVTLAPTTSFSAPLGMDVEFLYPDAITLDITPTYWLQNSLDIDTDFLSRLGFSLSVLELGTPLGNLGPLYSADFQTNPVSIGIDDRSFGLAFNSYEGATFQLTTVPEPATWLLLGGGLLALGALARRRRPR